MGPFSVQCVRFSEGDGGGNEEEVGMRNVQGISLVIHISLKINFPSCGAPGLGTLENISGIDVRVSAKQM